MEKTRVALIPAYQPNDALPELVERLSGLGVSSVVVDDGSGTAYQPVFTRCLPRAVLLRHAENAGKGRALKTGLREIARRYGQDCTVVTVDADGQHRAEDALAILAAAEEHPASLVLGSRTLGRSAPLRSRLGGAVTRALFRLSAGRGLRDTQTGLRAFDGGMIAAMLAIPGERYEYEMNVLLRFAREGREILERPIATVYRDGNAATHFDTLRDSARILREIVRFSASSLVAFLVDYALYALLTLLGAGPVAANVAARVVSACVNFTLNRALVFRDRGNPAAAAARYAALAAAVLACNTALLLLLVERCGVPRLPAKILAELCLFAVSWLAQRAFVFQGGRKR